MAWMSCFGFLVISVFFFGPGIHGQVTPPLDTTVLLGADVSLTCTSTETNPTFTWTVPEGQILYIGNARSTNIPRYDNIVLQEGTDPQTSILNINAIELEEDGEYQCSLTTLTTDPSSTIVTVEDQVTKSTSLLQYITILCDLPSQPNIVKCMGYCQQQGSILYEFISGGTLLTHLQTTGVQSQPTYNNLKPNRIRVDQDSLLNFAWQIAKGMQFLASKKIIHGTLCAHNVLLDERKQCKIADYGIASSLFNNRGKPTRWTSPETMVTGVRSKEGDSWSFGIVLWEIVTLGARPYPNMTFDIVRKEVANGYKMPRPRHCGQEVYDVMSLCWKKEGMNRSSFDQILKNLEKILEKNHNYLSLNDLDEGLYASTLDM